MGILHIYFAKFDMHKEHVEYLVEGHENLYHSMPLIHEIDIVNNHQKYIEYSVNDFDFDYMEMFDHRLLFQYNRLISIKSIILNYRDKFLPEQIRLTCRNCSILASQHTGQSDLQLLSFMLHLSQIVCGQFFLF
jgi:hypothetical protein